MKCLAIVSALPEELSGLRALLPEAAQETVAGRPFWRSQWQGLPLVLALCGMGKVAAASSATLLIDRFGADAVVFTGVAGGLGEGVRVGDLVLASSCVQHDMDASPIVPKHEVPGYGRSHFDTDAALSARLGAAVEAVLADWPRHIGPAVREAFGLHNPRLHRGLVLSGDRFVGCVEQSQALRSALPQALAVEMEGAAFAQVCHDFGVPLALLRSVSDRADAQAPHDFVRYLHQVAGPCSGAVLQAFLSSLSQPA